MDEFQLFWDLFNPDSQYNNRKAATWLLFRSRSVEDQKAMIADIQENGAPKNRNPYFYVFDFHRRAPRQQTMSFDDYYKKYGTTEETDGWKRVFKPEERRTIYVKGEMVP